MARKITLTKRLITGTPDGHTTEAIHGPVHAELVSDNGHEIEALVTTDDGRQLTVHTNWTCALSFAATVRGTADPVLTSLGNPKGDTMITLFKLAYTLAEPRGATPRHVTDLMGVIARALALPDHADHTYLLTDDQADRARTPGNAVMEWLDSELGPVSCRHESPGPWPLTCERESGHSGPHRAPVGDVNDALWGRGYGHGIAYAPRDVARGLLASTVDAQLL